MKAFILLFFTFFNLNCFAASRVGKEIPVQIVTGSTSYQIPANYYAKVKVNVIGSEVFRVNSIIVLRASSNLNLARINIFETSNASNYSPSSVMINSGTLTYTRDAVTTSTNQFISNQSYTLPTGTIIDGGTWVAELYRY